MGANCIWYNFIKCCQLGLRLWSNLASRTEDNFRRLEIYCFADYFVHSYISEPHLFCSQYDRFRFLKARNLFDRISLRYTFLDLPNNCWCKRCCLSLCSNTKYKNPYKCRIIKTKRKNIREFIIIADNQGWRSSFIVHSPPPLIIHIWYCKNKIMC